METMFSGEAGWSLALIFTHSSSLKCHNHNIAGEINSSVSLCITKNEIRSVFQVCWSLASKLFVYAESN